MINLMFLLCFWASFAVIGSVAVDEGECTMESCEAYGDWHVADDEFSWCNVGSACREEFREANGSEAKIWPELTSRQRTERIKSEKNRIRLNEYQPLLVPKFTEVGYKKEKLNPETYSFLMAWYSRRSPVLESVKESWPPDNTYVNHWKQETTMMHAPSMVHRRLYKDLLTPMEEWTGLKLKPTACYGARNYFRGSVLANHVDRIDTHVVSAIINIAQENVDTDWPLFVRGHDGVARNLFIQPGEIIFYESASVLHGRPEPFQGDSFTNIFVHFAPVEGWDVSANDVNRAAREGARKKARESRTAPLKNK